MEVRSDVQREVLATGSPYSTMLLNRGFFRIFAQWFDSASTAAPSSAGVRYSTLVFDFLIAAMNSGSRAACATASTSFCCTAGGVALGAKKPKRVTSVTS